MATTATYVSGIEESVKLEAERICAEEGLTLAEVFQRVVLRTVRDKHVPYELFQPNTATVEAMEAARRGELITVGDFKGLIAELHADD